MTTQNTYSQFLELPAELRLMIYSYALTNSVPVLATVVSINTDDGSIQIPKIYAQEEHHTRYTLETPQTPKAEFNQLRYVCRLLCQDTRGLSLRYNDLVFMKEPGTRTPAQAICARFLEAIPASAQARIRQITVIADTVTPRPLEHASITRDCWYDIGQLLTGGEYPIIHSFCRANPTAKVVLRYDTRRMNKFGYEKPLVVGTRYALLHASLRFFLRGSSAVEAGLLEAMTGGSSHPQHHYPYGLWRKIHIAEWVIATCMIPAIKTTPDAEKIFKGALLDNFRVTISRWYRVPSPLWVMKDEWYAAARREFEEGC